MNAHNKKSPTWGYHVLQKFGQEQHGPDSSNHSLHLKKLSTRQCATSLGVVHHLPLVQTHTQTQTQTYADRLSIKTVTSHVCEALVDERRLCMRSLSCLLKSSLLLVA